MFLPPQDDPHSIQLMKFYCGITCLYFPLLTIFVLCTELIYQTGKYSFLPVLGLMALFELFKCLFIMNYCKENDKHLLRHKSNRSSFKGFFTEKKIKEMVKGLFLLSLVTFSYYVIAVLFGAEVFSNYEETLMFGLLVSTLTALPPCLHLGPNIALAAILGDDNTSGNPLSPVLQLVVRGTLLGSWLGAFVIPLDWDRPWQVWPVPCCIGALMGYVASHTFAMIQVAMPKYLKNKIARKIY